MQARSEAPQGVIAFAAPLQEVELTTLLQRRPNNPPFLVAVDGVTDPGNLGAILRSADGAGVSGVVMPRHRAVHITPTAAKSAAGAIEHVPMSLAPGLPNALQRMRFLPAEVGGRKVKQLVLSGRHDLVIVDTPASGHAVTFLLSPRGLLDAVKLGMACAAQNVAQLLPGRLDAPAARQLAARIVVHSDVVPSE